MPGMPINISPDLARNPGLAMDALRSGNQQTADVLAHVNKTVQSVDAVNDHMQSEQSNGFWDTVLNKTGEGIWKGLDFLGKPLQEVQKNYKFLHYTWTEHGPLEGFVATLGIAGGAVLGSFGGPLGTVIGADVAGYAERKIFGNLDRWKDSAKAAEDPNYVISAGRDFSNAASQIADVLGADGIAAELKKTDTGKGKIVSGSADLVADVVFDPINIIGRFKYLMQGGKYLTTAKISDDVLETQLKYPLLKSIDGAKSWLEARSLRVFTPEQIDAVRAGGVLNSTSRLYNRALEDIANTIKEAKPTVTKLSDGTIKKVSAAASVAGEIAVKYPELGSAAAGRIAQLKNIDEIHDFFKTSLYFGELKGTLAGAAMLPTRSLLKTKISDLQTVEKLRNADNIFSSVYKTFSGYMPYSVSKLGELSLQKFTWDSPDASNAVYRTARFIMPDSAAKEWAGQYALAIADKNIKTAKAVYTTMLGEVFKKAGLPDDHILITNLRNDLEDIVNPNHFKEAYGSGLKKGIDVSIAQTESGPRPLALDVSQAGTEFTFPNFMALKSEMRKLGTLSKVYGPIDEFAHRVYTAGIFKPLALATLGFGLRVSASELLPTFARFGTFKTFQAAIAKSAAKLNYKLDSGEGFHILGATLSALGSLGTGMPATAANTMWPAFREATRRGLVSAAKMTAPEQFELANKLIIANEAHILREAVSTGNGNTASTAYELQNLAHNFMQKQYKRVAGKQYTTFSPGSKDYLGRLHNILFKAKTEPSKVALSQDIQELTISGENPFKVVNGKIVVNPAIEKELINRERARIEQALLGNNPEYERERQLLARYDVQAPVDFAADRVDNFLGLIAGQNGTYRKDFVDAMASKKGVDLETLQKIDTRELPLEIAGPETISYMGGAETMLQKLINVGFKRFVDPIINNLSREPMYLMHVADEYSSMKYLLGKGLEEDQLLRIAQQRAVNAMIPQIHNTALRSQFSQLARNFLPFYFAQEQAMKRTYRLAKETGFGGPIFSRGLRMYQAAEHILNDPAFVKTDDTGNRYITLPVVGMVGETIQNGLGKSGLVNLVTELPVSAQGNLVSLKTVLPEMQLPGVTPFVSFAGNIIDTIWPQSGSYVEKVIGPFSYQKGIIDTFTPATWMKSVFSALTPDQQNKALSNAVFGAMMSAYYHGQVPDANAGVTERQDFADRIVTNARSILFMKAALNLISPLAPRVSQEDLGLRDDYYKMLKEKGNHADALLEFLGKYGETAIGYTVSANETAVPGAYLPYTQQAIDFVSNNQELIKKYKDAPVFLIPQEDGSGDKQVISNIYLKQNLKIRKSPREFLDTLYITMGDHLIRGPRQEHTQIVNEAKAIGDTVGLQAEMSRWNDFMKGMETMHPTWYNDYMSPESKNNAQRILDQLQAMFAAGDAPAGKQTDLVAALLKDYNTHLQRVNENQMLGIADMTKMEKQNWETYLVNLRESNPRLSSIINSIFLKLG